MKRVFLRVIKYLLSIIVLLAILIFALWAYPFAEPLAQKSEDHSYLIQHINIVDVANDSILANHSIYIEKDRIISMAPTDSFPNIFNAIKIDGTGQFALAGLWDMHSHLAFQIAPQVIMPLHIANGVTNIRDMQGIVNINEERLLWRNAIEEKQLLSPRLIGFADEIVGANYDEQDVVALVNRTSKDPRTFIKVYSGILADRYFQLAEEANNKGVVFAGHYPNAINPIDASNAGQRSFEHAHLFIKHANPLADQNRAYYQAMYADDENSDIDRPSSIDMLAGFEEEKFNELVEVMVKNNTYFCPTHITRQYEAFASDETFLDDPNLAFIPPMVSMIWNDDVSGMQDYAQQDGYQQYLEDFYQKGLELTGIAHQRGVKVLAGTDSYDPYSFPGFSLHRELAELVKAGLTPADALACATINPAEYFKVSQDYGSVEEGKVADLLILNQNPLVDIQNTTSIDKLFFNGNLYKQEDLQHMKNYVQENASGIKGLSISVKMFFRLMSDNRH